MADKKVTTMVIKVDLGCEKCKKKIKKILCGIAQIQSQIYDEKNNTVTVTVLCCSPEKIKKKICCKGGDSIKGIEIKEPEPKPTPSNKTEEKPNQKPTPTPKPPAPAPAPVRPCCRECYKGYDGGPCYQGLGSMGPCSFEAYGTPASRYEAYGRPVYDSWGGSGGAVYYGGCRRGCYGGRCDCIREANPSECSVM